MFESVRGISYTYTSLDAPSVPITVLYIGIGMVRELLLVLDYNIIIIAVNQQTVG